jgi:hypothetical protein
MLRPLANKLVLGPLASLEAFQIIIGLVPDSQIGIFLDHPKFRKIDAD